MYLKKVYIEITNMCNKNCSFCSPMLRKKEEMSLKNFEHILKEIKSYTKYIYLHVKGEPLLHSKLEGIIKLCEKHEMAVNITTNGTLLKKNKEILLSPSIRQINVSLHSFSSEPNYIEDILETTSYLLDHTKIYINYRFWALNNKQLTNKNLMLLKKIESYFQVSIINELKKTGKKTINDHLFIETGDSFEWPTLSSSFYETKGTCYGLRTHFGILVDGTVVPCCLDADGIVALGNLLEESLSDILSKERTLKIIKQFQNHSIKEELCRHCSYRKRFEE